jgi:hypothetical protein
MGETGGISPDAALEGFDADVFPALEGPGYCW